MEDLLIINETKVPSIQELYNDPAITLKQDQVLYLLNQPPPSNWIVKHPHIPNHKYLPIGKVEFLLKKLFKGYTVEVKKTGVLFNAIEVVVRLGYIDILTGEWIYQEGVGACELQTEAKTGVLKLDFSNVNRGAVAMALPIAKTIALKDAADHIGKIFGSDINRKDVPDLSPDLTLADVAKQKEQQRMEKLIEKAKDRAALEGLKSHVTEQLQAKFDEKWNQLT